MPTKTGPGRALVARNRRARHEYDILDTYEAGIVLVGGEVKSFREGRVQLRDSFAKVEDGEVWLHGMRSRKLLLHRRQIQELARQTQQTPLTLVPLSAYFKDGRVKVELALARGRRDYDKRRAIAERDADREARREVAAQRRRQDRH